MRSPWWCWNDRESPLIAANSRVQDPVERLAGNELPALSAINDTASALARGQTQLLTRSIRPPSSTTRPATWSREATPPGWSP